MKQPGQSVSQELLLDSSPEASPMPFVRKIELNENHVSVPMDERTAAITKCSDENPSSARGRVANLIY
jgi:hypothetical protein